MVFGKIKYRIVGDNYARFYRRMLECDLPCNKLSESGSVLTFEISVEYARQAEQLCDELGLEYEIISKQGMFVKLRRMLSHKGLIVGAVFVLVISVMLSNVVLRFRILCDDNNTKKAIMAVLKENGVQAGSYIPDLDLAFLERELKQHVDEISWAGISVSGSTLVIDTVENVDKPESRKIRMPCDLIAEHDAVIDKVEIYDGQLLKTVGSAVSKGDVIVSGRVVNESVEYKDGKEIKDTDTKYVRAFGKVYGTFEQTVTVTQPFSEVQKNISDEEKKRYYLRLFDIQLPIFASAPKGNYESSTEYNGLKLFGIDIPLGINTVTLSEYNYSEHMLTKEEARKKAELQLKKHENNFFEDYEIKAKNTNIEVTDEGVKLKAVYTLYGEIAKESEFFIEK